MALRLTVQRAAWESHLQSFAGTVDGLVPVVKGNGYGFGRYRLHPIAAGLSELVCVGTVDELDGVAPGVTPVVLTPTLLPPSTTEAVLTVGSIEQVKALSGWHGRVLVKLQSSMRRYGAAPVELEQVVADATAAGLDVVGSSLHLPLAGTDLDRIEEIEAWLGRLDTRLPMWLSHLQPRSFASLQHLHPDRHFRLRVGTSLWHGDKSFLQLNADVLALHEVRQGERAGYHLTDVPCDGHLVVVGAGSAHGIAALPNGKSPFHFSRTRLALLEPPHMHTSMVLAPTATPCPAVGDRVDVQRPLIATFVDEVEWM
jgi:alanine racemase